MGCLATAVALAIAWQTRVRAVGLTLDVRHGVHAGDLVAFAVAYTWATVLTAAITG